MGALTTAPTLALGFAVLTGLPVLAAVLRRRSHLVAARAYREVRRRAVRVLRLQREDAPASGGP